MHSYILKELLQWQTPEQQQPPNDGNRNILFKYYAPFTKCISEINNTQVDDTHDIGAVMPKYNLIEYRDIYSKTSGRLWQ